MMIPDDRTLISAALDMWGTCAVEGGFSGGEQEAGERALALSKEYAPLSPEAAALIGRLLSGEDAGDVQAEPDVWEAARAAFPAPDMDQCGFCGDGTPVALTHCQTCGAYLRAPSPDTRILWGGVTFADVGDALRPVR